MDAATPKAAAHALPAINDAVDLTTSTCALSNDGHYLFALRTGHAVNRPAGDPATWVTAFDTTTFEAVGGPQMLPGVAETFSVRPVEDAACWISTWTPGSAFAYATRVRVKDASFDKESQIAFTGASEAPRLAAEPSGARMAVGLNRTIEVWEGLERGQIAHEYKSVIRDLIWTEQGLLGRRGRTCALGRPQDGGANP